MNSKLILGIIVLALIVIGGMIVIPNDSDNGSETESVEKSESADDGMEQKDDTVMRGGGEESMQSTANTSEVEVQYTNAGFEPKVITINKGQTITWTNNSSRSMWIASALHPSHNVYPVKSDDDCLGSSFDACTFDKTYSFTFDIVGEWNYHNHVQAGRTGKVIVK